MYTFTLTKSRLALLTHWENGNHPPVGSIMPAPIKDKDNLQKKLVIIARYLLREQLSKRHGCRVEEDARFVCGDYLFFNPDFFAGRLNPLRDISMQSIIMTHHRITWNEFVDLPFSMIESVLKDRDTLYFFKHLSDPTYGDKAGVFVNMKEALLSKATFTHTQVEKLMEPFGYSPKFIFPVFRIHSI